MEYVICSSNGNVEQSVSIFQDGFDGESRAPFLTYVRTWIGVNIYGMWDKWEKERCDICIDWYCITVVKISLAFVENITQFVTVKAFRISNRSFGINNPWSRAGPVLFIIHNYELLLFNSPYWCTIQKNVIIWNLSPKKFQKKVYKNYQDLCRSKYIKS